MVEKQQRQIANLVSILKIILTTFILVCPSLMSAQKTRIVEGEYTYMAPETIPLEEARRIALERAKLQALADEYGTIVSQTNSTRINNSKEKSDIDFFSVSGSEVKGEWISTIGKPEFDIKIEDYMQIVYCKVRGKTREIKSSKVNFKALLLRNGEEDRYADDRFRNKDRIRLAFQSPVDGFLAVYAMDETDSVACCLPHSDSNEGAVAIEHDKRYVFFDENHPFVTLTNKEREYNTIYVLFSPHRFVKAVEDYGQKVRPDKYTLLSSVSKKGFVKWLEKVRIHDVDMVVYPFHIMITNSN